MLNEVFLKKALERLLNYKEGVYEQVHIRFMFIRS